MKGSSFMTRRSTRLVLMAAALIPSLVTWSCESSETVAPEGATISLSANPAQIVLASGIQSQPVTLLATVRNVLGVPLPGQDVRFTTTSGVLDPLPGTPVETDANGNAFATLTQATQGPTIMASSGAASASLTLTAATGLLSTITLSPNSVVFNTCSDMPQLTATALDPDGNPIQGVSIEFIFVNPGMNTPQGSFNPSPGQSDAMGKVTTTLTFVVNDCQTKCGSGKTCTGTIQARNIGQTVTSNTATLTDAVP